MDAADEAHLQVSRHRLEQLVSALHDPLKDDVMFNIPVNLRSLRLQTIHSLLCQPLDRLCGDEDVALGQQLLAASEQLRGLTLVLVS